MDSLSPSTTSSCCIEVLYSKFPPFPPFTLDPFPKSHLSLFCFKQYFFPSYVHIDILLTFSPLLKIVSLLLIFLFCSFLYIQRTSNNPRQKWEDSEYCYWFICIKDEIFIHLVEMRWKHSNSLYWVTVLRPLENSVIFWKDSQSPVYRHIHCCE